MHAGLCGGVVGLAELPLEPLMEAMLTILPQPRSSMPSMNGRVTLKTESRLTRRTASQSA
jgi:hypothetical protein